MESHGNFDLVKRVKLDYADITLEKWTSRETGLSVAHLDCETPLVQGYFTLRTEIFDDTGRPHTLEHLVFLGSEKYPFKGVLDSLANRAFSNGTNAWTDTDNTTYTITTAGSDGFLRLLPVYIDHILYPTMTDEGFVTEVHHINEKAEDAGVVYAEMQGREQTSGDLMALQMQRTFYPEGSAYRSETGGLMEALRVLTAESIREYHRAYYVPRNLCLIVAGKLKSTKDLLNVLQNEVEPSILEHSKKSGPQPGWKRPFVETPSAQRPDIKASVTREIEFPEKDESQGEISVSWVGPENSDTDTRKALDILSTYLTDSPIAPLMKEFVEIPSPLCSWIYGNENVRASFSTLETYFGGVPVEELNTLVPKVIDCLKRIVAEGIDMERMESIISRDRRKFLSLLESGSGEYYSSNLINDFLYGAANGDDIGPMMKDLERYQTLSTWTAQQWSDLLTKYFIDNPSVVVIGKPSSTLPDTLEATEKARIAAQKEALGEEGLAKLVKKLEDAKAAHEKPIPQELLTSFPVPALESISWIPVQSARTQGGANTELQKHVGKDGTDVPFFVQFDHVKSSFITISAYLSLADVPTHLLPYVTVYLSSFFSLPVTRSDGTKLNHEDVVKHLDNLTVGYGTGMGRDDWFQNLLRFDLKVEKDQYANAVMWLKDLIYGSEFTKDRLEVTIAKVQQSLPELKRDGNTVLNAVHSVALYNETSASTAGCITNAIENIPKLAQRLKDEPDAVIAEFETIRKAITKPEGVRFSVYGNVLGIETPKAPWKVFNALPAAQLRPPPSAADSLNDLGKQPTKKGIVVTLPTIESSYALHTAKSISGFSHPDHAALRVACEVLEGTESYLWRYIRGSGLAYGANMSVDTESGLISFSVYKAPDSYRAFEEGKKVVQGLVDGSIALEQTVLDGAKSSLVYSAARAVSSPGRAAVQSFLNQALKGVSQNYGREMLEKMQAVTIDDVKRVLATHILPIFDPSTSIAVVVSSPGKAESIAKQLAGAGYDVESRTIEADPEDDDGTETGESDSDEEEK